MFLQTKLYSKHAILEKMLWAKGGGESREKHNTFEFQMMSLLFSFWELTGWKLIVHHTINFHEAE